MNNPSKTIARRTFIASAMASSTLLASPAIVQAQSATVLRFSSWLPAASLITQNLFAIWASEIANVTDGRVQVEILEKPFGPPPAHLGLVQSGDADIVYSLHGYTQEAFPRANVGQFSFLGDAYSASHAFSKVYGKLLKAEEEHQDMKLLGLFQHGPGVLMLKDKVVRTPEDYKGLRIRTSGGYIAALIEDMGGTNVPMSPLAVRQALIDGEIDGVAFPYEAGPAFGVTEQITFVSELPNGYYNATWFLGMSNAAADKLSPEDLAAVQTYSASTVHALAAKAFDYADFLGKEAFLEAGITIEPTSDAVTNHIKGIASGYEKKWAEDLSRNGYDGEKALAFTRRITSGG